MLILSHQWLREYSELLEAVREIYDNLLNEDRGYKYAIARTFYEFETVCNEGKTENLLVHLAIGEIILTRVNIISPMAKCTNKFSVLPSLHTVSNS